MKHRITLPATDGKPITIDFRSDPMSYIRCVPEAHQDVVKKTTVDLRERRQQWRKR